MKNLLKKKFLIISTLAVFLVLGAGLFVYYHPITYVSVDVNPSIEFKVNMFGDVISAEGVNDDGTAILNNVSNSDTSGSGLTSNELTGSDIKNAVGTTVGEIADQGYFDGEVPNEIVITTSSGNTEDDNKLAEELKDASQKVIDEKNLSVEIESQCVGKENVKKARELGTTPGKLLLIERLKATSTDPNSIKVEDWINKSVKDIKLAIKENKLTTLLTDEQKASIQPALDAYNAELKTAEETFKASFETLKTDYTAKLEAFKAQYASQTKVKVSDLAQLKKNLLNDYHAIMKTFKDSVKTAKDNFIKATANSGIDTETLNEYANIDASLTLSNENAFKDYLKLFTFGSVKNGHDDVSEDESSNPKENKKAQSKTQYRNESGESEESEIEKDVPKTGDKNKNGKPEEKKSGDKTQANSGTANTSSSTTENKTAIPDNDKKTVVNSESSKPAEQEESKTQVQPGSKGTENKQDANSKKDENTKKH